MLQLEEMLLDALITQPKLEKLLEIYKVCAEFYDAVRDPITTYFTEKIQKTVSHKTVLALFMKSRPSEGPTYEETVATRTRRHTEQGLRRMLSEHEDKVKNDKKGRWRFKLVTLESERMKRSHRLKLDLEIDKTLDNHQSNASELLIKSYERKATNDKLINDSLDAQKEALKRKLDARRNNSFIRSSSKLDTSTGSVKVSKLNNTTGGADDGKNVNLYDDDSLTIRNHRLIFS